MLLTRCKESEKQNKNISNELNQLSDEYERNRKELVEKKSVDMRLRSELMELRKARDSFKFKAEDAIKQEMKANMM